MTAGKDGECLADRDVRVASVITGHEGTRDPTGLLSLRHPATGFTPAGREGTRLPTGPAFRAR